MILRPRISSLPYTLVPYTTFFRSPATAVAGGVELIYPVRDRYEPGQDVLMVGYTLTAEPGDRGPYYAWLRVDPAGEARGVVVGSADADRSEEHTSELQRLTRISYAV